MSMQTCAVNLNEPSEIYATINNTYTFRAKLTFLEKIKNKNKLEHVSCSNKENKSRIFVKLNCTVIFHNI